MMHHHALARLATDTLSALVRDGFGPCAAGETLLFAPPDPPLVTADGHTILMQWRRGLRESHRAPEPVQLFVLAAADALHVRDGDGASEFVLLLHNVVARATSSNGTTVRWRELSDAFGDLRREIDALLAAERSGTSLGLCVTVPITFEYSGDGCSATPSKEVRYECAVRRLRIALKVLSGPPALFTDASA